MEREHLGSRLGFILLSAGCAIGIGNVWKFPYITGMNGGGTFVLIYLFFLALLGIPVMTMEFAMGRAAQRSPAKLYQQLDGEKSKWRWHGIVQLCGQILLMMFYTNVSGWMLRYFVDFANGSLMGLDPAGVESHFAGMLSDLPTSTIYMGIVVVTGFLVNSFGVQKGLERVSKWMMLALLGIMVVLAVNSIFTKGGQDGLAFYLLPDMDRLMEAGIGNAVVDAMNQSFFTLSLGIGSMAIFGSYIGKDRALLGEAVNVAVLDTFVAITSGLIIFPACFAYGVDVDQGPALIFVTLPNIFNDMPMGQLWGSLFFVFMTFAAFSTILAVFESIIACVMDLTGWSRKKTSLILCPAIFVLSLPCVLGYSIWSDFQPLGAGSAVLDLEDFIVSNFLLPLGSLIFVIFCTTRYGWGWDKFVSEANQGKGLKIAKWMRPYCTYVLPLIVLIVFIVGII